MPSRAANARLERPKDNEKGAMRKGEPGCCAAVSRTKGRRANRRGGTAGAKPTNTMRRTNAQMDRANKKRCWMLSNSAFVRALSASIVSSFSTCKFGASELRRRLNNPVFSHNLALSLVVHSSTQIAQSRLVSWRAPMLPRAAVPLERAAPGLTPPHVRAEGTRQTNGAPQRKYPVSAMLTRAAASPGRRSRRRFHA